MSHDALCECELQGPVCECEDADRIPYVLHQKPPLVVKKLPCEKPGEHPECFCECDPQKAELNAKRKATICGELQWPCERYTYRKMKIYTGQEVKDPYSDHANPIKIDFDAVKVASIMISGGVEYTPCDRSRIEESYGMELYYKKEYLQNCGSFQDRGALNTVLLLPELQKKYGVITCSGGNFGVALSYYCKGQNIPVTVIMPKNHSQLKADRCRGNNARLIIHGETLTEGRELAFQICKRDRLRYINGYDYPDVIAANGTIAMEILEEVEEPDAIVVPVGGGGLLAGICVAVEELSPKTKVIGVETVKRERFATAVETDCPYLINEQTATILEPPNLPLIGYNAYFTSKSIVDKIVIVNDRDIAVATMRLLEIEKVVVEASGAAPLAAVIAGHLPELKGKKVVMVLSAGNIDVPHVVRCIHCGLADAERLMRFNCYLHDKPEEIEELTKSLTEWNVLVKKMTHHRATVDDIFVVKVCVVLQSITSGRFTEIQQKLREKYPDVEFPDVTS